MSNKRFNVSDVSAMTSYPWSHFAIIVILMISLVLVSMRYNQTSLGIALSGLFYIGLQTSFRRGIFRKDSVEIQYPIRFFWRKKIILYEDIAHVRKGQGTYLDGSLLLIGYRLSKNGRPGTQKQIGLVFPQNEMWEKIKDVLPAKVQL